MVKTATAEETASLAKKLQAEKKRYADQAKSSLLPSKRGVKETFHILKGEKHGYDLVLEYPGTMVAMTLFEEAERSDGNGYYPSVMIAGAINEGVVKYPTALVDENLDFFDSHGGTAEVANAIYKFLREKLE